MFLFLAVHSLYIPCVGHRGPFLFLSPGGPKGKRRRRRNRVARREVPKKEVFRQEEKAARTARVQKEEEKVYFHSSPRKCSCGAKTFFRRSSREQTENENPKEELLEALSPKKQVKDRVKWRRRRRLDQDGREPEIRRGRERERERLVVFSVGKWRCGFVRSFPSSIYRVGAKGGGGMCHCCGLFNLESVSPKTLRLPNFLFSLLDRIGFSQLKNVGIGRMTGTHPKQNPADHMHTRR